MQSCLYSSHHPIRTFSTEDDGGSTAHAFDRKFKTLQRSNAARAQAKWQSVKSPETVSYDYIRDEIATRLVDRLDDIKHDGGFPLALDLGSGSGHVYRAICAEPALEGQGGIGGVQKLVQMDSSQEMLNRDADVRVPGADLCGTYRLVGDEESKLPFPDGTFDLVISSGSLHWINDLPAVLKEGEDG